MQLKWEHLYEADARSQALLRRWKSSGDAVDLEAWIKVAGRSDRAAAALLKENVPKKPEDFRDEIEEAAGKSLFVFAYYAQQDRLADEGDPTAQSAGSGGDWMDEAPRTPSRAVRSGKSFIRRVEQDNRLDINKLYWVAVNMPGKHYREPTPEYFGHYLMAQALGHGVSWEDDHPDPDIKLPYWNYEI